MTIEQLYAKLSTIKGNSAIANARRLAILAMIAQLMNQ